MTSAAGPATGPAATRRREHEWTDPMALAAAASGLDGLEYLRRIVDGRLPGAPVASLVGFRAVSAEHGRVAFAFEPGEHQYNPIGSVHGGVYATLLDSACGCAVHSTLPAAGYTSLDLSVRFLRRITVETGTVTCTGHVVQAGRRTALARAELTDAEGRLLGEATSSCLILPEG
ncbi:PaaI family thioesterase [Pseudonocardia sp. HH130629-09]|uniref:PaaI family thioesterase n=1 Tax=Pseudonocardia sp. HH130629-09 TaxID=1641402 RepID=UPI0006CB02D4|nr:PaaI family thioesterase [Pseudonocardia sp. HH130629-09]ALE84776.1 aromatic compound degradation protein PaaI [Pseudonocardia sp. HH130629-09]